MKAAVCLLAFSVIAVTYGEYCGGSMRNDPNVCTHTCAAGKGITCVRQVCSCDTICADKTDCIDTKCSGMTDPMGHQHNETVHCFDKFCTCIPDFTGGDHHMGGGHSGGGHMG